MVNDTRDNIQWESHGQSENWFNKPKDIWDKTQVLATVIGAVLIGIAGLVINRSIAKEAERNRQNETIVDILTAREQAYLSFKADQVEKLFNSLIASKKPIEERVQSLGFYQEYFHDILDGRPFFKSLYDEAKKSLNKSACEEIIKIAKHNAQCQAKHISECDSSAFTDIFEIEENNVRPVNITCSGDSKSKYVVEIAVGTIPDEMDAVPITLYLQGNPEKSDSITHNLTYFDFPFTQDFLHLGEHSFALVLSEVTHSKVNKSKHVAKIRVLEFENDFLPNSYWLPIEHVAKKLNHMH